MNIEIKKNKNYNLNKTKYIYKNTKIQKCLE